MFHSGIVVEQNFSLIYRHKIVLKVQPLLLKLLDEFRKGKLGLRLIHFHKIVQVALVHHPDGVAEALVKKFLELALDAVLNLELSYLFLASLDLYLIQIYF